MDTKEVKAKKWPWTDAQTNRVVELYKEVETVNTSTMQSIADTLMEEFPGYQEIGYRHVIGKLTHEKVYVAPEKQKASTPRNEGPTKGDILAAIKQVDPDGFTDEIEEGFKGAKRDSLMFLANKVGLSIS